jgi:hypothetical protein
MPSRSVTTTGSAQANRLEQGGRTVGLSGLPRSGSRPTIWSETGRPLGREDPDRPDGVLVTLLPVELADADHPQLLRLGAPAGREELRVDTGVDDLRGRGIGAEGERPAPHRVGDAVHGRRPREQSRQRLAETVLAQVRIHVQPGAAAAHHEGPADRVEVGQEPVSRPLPLEVDDVGVRAYDRGEVEQHARRPGRPQQPCERRRVGGGERDQIPDEPDDGERRRLSRRAEPHETNAGQARLRVLA